MNPTNKGIASSSSSSSSSSLFDTTMKPFLGIRLLRSSSPTKASKVTSGMDINEDVEDSCCELIEILHRQDQMNYICQDYLSVMNSSSSSATDADQNEFDVDYDCREKMIEWCYRVCDCRIFPCEREMVAIATSYLDRYMTSIQAQCTRATFKLAAVTSFYLATKIMTNMQIRIDSLVQLGRGSFTHTEILEMEQSLIDKLQWYLNPPTVQCIIRQLYAFVQSIVAPSSTTSISIQEQECIFHRAIYFAELSVYEYRFVTKDRLTLATACILNAIAAVLVTQRNHHKRQQLCSNKNDIVLQQQQQQEQPMDDMDLRLRTISSQIVDRVLNIVTFTNNDDSDTDFGSNVKEAQRRLWYLYSCSAQVSDDDDEIIKVIPKQILYYNNSTGGSCTQKSANPTSPISNSKTDTIISTKTDPSSYHSPVSTAA